MGDLADCLSAVAAVQDPDGGPPGRRRRDRSASRRTKNERQPVRYVAILDLVVTHAFYADGRCADLAIELSDETARLLRNHRCIVGSSSSGVRVQAALDPATARPFLPLAPDAVLRFRLRLDNADFGLFTDLDAMAGLSSPLFTNAAPAGGGPGELTLVAGATAQPPGVFAEVEIHLDGWGLGGGIPAFVVAFKAKHWRWAYYCITDLVPNGGDLTIVDASPAGTPDVLVFSAANTAKLDEVPDPYDPIGVQLAGRYPAMRRLRMLSDKAVACFEEPKRYLELRHGADRLSGSLPNPSVRRVSRISTPGQSQDLLFQILKYRANPL